MTQPFETQEGRSPGKKFRSILRRRVPGRAFLHRARDKQVVHQLLREVCCGDLIAALRDGRLEGYQMFYPGPEVLRRGGLNLGRIFLERPADAVG